MKYKKTPEGLYFHRFTTDKNAAGISKRIYIQCKAEYNNTSALTQLIRDACKRHMDGLFTTSDTFESYVREKFLAEYPAAQSLEKASIDSLKYLLQKVVFETRHEDNATKFGALPLAGIDTRSLSRLAGALRGKMKTLKMNGKVKRAYSDQTVRLALVAVMSVLRWAKQTGELTVVPDFEVPKVAESTEAQPYTPLEAMTMLALARTDSERLMFLLMFDAGLRKSEVLGLQPEQLNFATHILTVDRQLYRGVFKRYTKGKRRRHVDMSAELETALKLVLASRIRPRYVLEDEIGEPYNEHWVRWIFIRCRRAGNVPRKRVHDARHLFADLRTAQGTDPFKLQELMGHADIRTTQGYVHPVAVQPISVMASAAPVVIVDTMRRVQSRTRRSVVAARKRAAG